MAWGDKGAAKAFEGDGLCRKAHVRVLPDYGVFDQPEAPQYHPGVERSESASLKSLIAALRRDPHLADKIGASARKHAQTNSLLVPLQRATELKA